VLPKDGRMHHIIASGRLLPSMQACMQLRPPSRLARSPRREGMQCKAPDARARPRTSFLGHVLDIWGTAKGNDGATRSRDTMVGQRKGRYHDYYDHIRDRVDRPQSSHTHTHCCRGGGPSRPPPHPPDEPPRLASRGTHYLCRPPHAYGACCLVLLLPLGSISATHAYLHACTYRKCVLFCMHACIMHAWMVSTFDRRTLTDFNQASVVLLCNGPADIYI
jgi:hypothetical protein